MNILTRSCLRTLPLLNVYRNGLAVRTIFTQETLGITAYIKDREIDDGRAPTKLFDILNDEERLDQAYRYPLDKLVDDLRVLVHVVKPSEVDLLKRALEIYRIHSLTWSKKDDGQKKTYSFGSIVMRFFSHYKMPEYAVQFFFDDQIGPLFDDLASYTILLDMLYDDGKYAELINITDLCRERMKPQKLGSTFLSINAIVFAACLQSDTPEYRQHAYDLYERIKSENLIDKQLRKGIIQVAEMKRRDKQPEECLKILSEIESKDISGRYVEILALLDLNRLEEAWQLLTAISRINNFSKVFPVPKELLERIKSKMKAEKKELTDLETVIRKLDRSRRITDKPLNDAICQPYSKRLVLFRQPYRYTKLYN